MFGFGEKENIRIRLKYKFTDVSDSPGSGLGGYYPETNYYIVDENDIIYKYKCYANPYRIFYFHQMKFGNLYNFILNEDIVKIEK